MKINLLTRRRTVADREVQEPTVLAILLNGIAFVVLLVVCILGIAFLPAFGHIWWTFAAVAAILVSLILRLKGHPVPRLPTGRQRWLHRIRGWGRVSVMAVLGCWLGLIVWLEFCPGGSGPISKADPAAIRVITWNIHCGQDDGLPWKCFDWPGRKMALRAAVDQARPDILCVQEATPVQVAFLEKSLPGHRRVGIGRDGEACGEHCAVYFNRQRFEEIGGSTFWLEEPTDRPGRSAALDAKRICTWVRLRDRTSGRTIRLYNAHLYLWEAPRLKAARLILDHITAGDRTDAVLLTADFNATPSVPSRRVFLDAGLADSAERAGKPAGRPTFQLYGIGLWCIDGILTDSKWDVHDHRILAVKPGNTFPSDHFALLADLGLRE
jgi:endonuclease/exonuclease/phosphatase family metal-dependent hydrolase